MPPAKRRCWPLKARSGDLEKVSAAEGEGEEVCFLCDHVTHVRLRAGCHWCPVSSGPPSLFSFKGPTLANISHSTCWSLAILGVP